MKKSVKKLIIIICIFMGIIFGFVVILFGIAFKQFIYGEMDVTDVPHSISVNISVLNSSNSTDFETEQNVDLQWYETLDEALQNDELIRGETNNVDYKEEDAVELVQIQTSDVLAVFYTRAPKEGNVTRIFCVLVKIEDGKFSQPYKKYTFANRPGYPGLLGETTYSHDCDDSIVFYIEQETIIRNVFGNGENQIPVCFGMWIDQKEIESLTVAGQSPKVIPVVEEEDTRYFWYFENVDWLDRLKVINWSDYTYGQIIDLLEIKYNKAEEED